MVHTQWSIWYWVLYWVVYCFIMTDHVLSYQSKPPWSILNQAFGIGSRIESYIVSSWPTMYDGDGDGDGIYIYKNIHMYIDIYILYMYTYIFVYKPNTQYRPSYKERNFAKILPLFWPIVLKARLSTYQKLDYLHIKN